MNNFNTLMSVYGAFTHAAIGRLKNTLTKLPKSAAKVSIVSDHVSHASS